MNTQSLGRIWWCRIQPEGVQTSTNCEQSSFGEHLNWTDVNSTLLLSITSNIRFYTTTWWWTSDEHLYFPLLFRKISWEPPSCALSAKFSPHESESELSSIDARHNVFPGFVLRPKPHIAKARETKHHRSRLYPQVRHWEYFFSVLLLRCFLSDVFGREFCFVCGAQSLANRRCHLRRLRAKKKRARFFSFLVIVGKFIKCQ